MAMITLEYTPPTIVLSGVSEVFVTHVVDPSHFHCQLAESSSKLRVLMDELHQYCTSCDSVQELLQTIDLGTPCLAQYSGDQGWYRVIITGVLANGLVEVSFVDYGNNEVVSASKLRKMKPEFMELPIQAIQCGLAGIVSAQGYWSPEHIAQFEDLILEKAFLARFISLLEGDSVCSVELLDKAGKSMNKLYGTSTGTFKTVGNQRSSFPGADDIRVSVHNDVVNVRGSGYSDEERKVFKVEGGSAENRSSGTGRKNMGASRFSHGDGDRVYSANGDSLERGDRSTHRNEGPLNSVGGWSEDQGGHQRNAFAGGQGMGRRKANKFNGHDDRVSTDYSENTGKGAPILGNTWASGFGRTRNDMTNAALDVEDCYKCLTLGLGEVCDVYVAFVNTPDQFWIQLAKSTDQIDNLMEELENYYASVGQGRKSHADVRIGSVCAARYAEDGKWYRALVKTKEQDQFEVQFVDYGNTDFVSSIDIETLPSKFLSLPFQGIKCCLANVVNPESHEWKEAAIDKFEELTVDKMLSCKIIGPGKDGATAVDLICPDEEVSIAHCMHQAGFVKMRQTEKKQLAKPPPDPPALLDYNDQQIREGLKENVVVSWMTSPEDFWCQRVTHQMQIMELGQSLQLLYKKKGSTGLSSDSIVKDMAVVARFSEDGCWYRGKIVKPGPHQAQVLFVDYGNTETVSLADLQLTQMETMDLPKLALKCCLKDVKPTSGTEWKANTVSFLESVIGDEATAIFHKTKGDRVEIDLMSGGKCASDELVNAGYGKRIDKPCRSVKEIPLTPLVQLNQDVNVYVTSIDSISSFWCQPAFAQEVDLEEAYSGPCDRVANPTVGTICATKFSGDGLWYRAEIIQPTGNDFLVRFVDYGNMEIVRPSDIMCLKDEFCDIPAQSFHCCLHGITDTGNPEAKKMLNELTLEKELEAKVRRKDGSLFYLDLYDSGRSIAEQIQPFCSSSGPAEILEYLPVPNMAGQTIQAYISATVSVGEFFVQAADSQADLDKMVDLLKGYDHGKGCQLTNVQAGQICGVKFSEDGIWYRGLITSVTGNSATVLFVDYGNSEDIPLKDIKRILPSALDVPPLAFPCSLAAVQPPGGKWSQESLTVFEQLGLEKELTCKFITKSSVKLLCQGDDIGNMLVKAKLAVSVEQQGTQKKPKTLPKAEIPLGAMKGYITEVDSTGIIYVQCVKDEDKISELSERLQTYNDNFTAGMFALENIGTGVECCARFSEDGAWYRARIENTSNGHPTVRFVDFGNCDVIERVSELQSIPEEFLSTPPLCFAFKGPSTLSTEQVDDIMEFVDGKCFEFEVLSRAEPFEFKIKCSEGQQLLEKLRINTSGQEIVRENSVQLTTTKFPPAVIPIGRVEGYVTNVETSGLVSVQLVRDEERLVNLAENLQKLAVNMDDVKTVSDGSICCAKYSEDDMWYRAEVVECSSAKVKVRFVDYGNLDSVSSDALKEVPLEMLRESCCAVLCKLSNTEELSEEAVDSLILKTADKTCQLEFMSKTEPCEISLYSNDGKDLLGSASPLEANTTSTISAEVCKSRYRDQTVPLGEKIAFITHVDDSGLFYVQLDDDTSNIENLAEKVLSVCDNFEDTGTKLKDVTVGSVCCCSYSEDGLWYRAAVTVVEGSSAKVRFVDYGNEDHVDKEQLYEVPQELLSDPPYGFACQLSVDALSSTQVSKLRDIPLEESISLMFLTKQEPYMVSVKNADGTLLQDMLQTGVEQNEEDIDRLEDGTTSKEVINEGDQPKGMFKEIQLTEGRHERMHVTHVESPDLFWCHLADTEDELAELMEAIATYCAGLTGAGRLILAQNMACLARFSQDNGWYRAKVLELLDSGARVLFVDYGNSEAVPGTDIISIKPEHLDLPAQAIRCSLYSATVTTPQDWSRESLEKFTNFTADKELLTRVMSCKVELDGITHTYFVQLLDMGVDIYTAIRSTSNSQQTLDTTETNESLTLATDRSVPYITDSLKVQVSDSVRTMSETVDSVDRSTCNDTTVPHETFTHIALTDGSRVEVTVTHTLSPTQFWIQLKSNSTHLKTMMELLGETMTSALPEKVDLEIDQPCSALSAEDGLWYRGIVREVDMALGLIDVVFVDYGHTESVEKNNVRHIPPEFLALPVQAIECGLSGIRFQGTMWTDAAKHRFNSMVMEKSLVANILQVGEDDDCIVQLLDMGMCVATRMIAEGFGVHTDTPVPTPHHLRRVFNDTLLDDGSVGEEGREKGMSDSCDEECKNKIGKGDESLSRVKIGLGEEVNVIISYTVNPGDFWCHLCSSLPQLADLMSSLQVNFSQTSTESSSEVRWERGQLCVAQCCEDQQYYRGQIIDLTEESASVFFIDYGNTEQVARSVLQPISKALLNLPAQAVRCSLASIGPESGQWDDNSCSRFEELTYQKELLAKVLSISASGIIAITLQSDTFVINENLIQEGYAVRNSDKPGISLVAATPTEKDCPQELDQCLLGIVSQALKPLESTPLEDFRPSKVPSTDLPSPITGSENGDSCGPDLKDVTSYTIELKLTRYNHLELDVGSELSVYVCNITDPGNFGVQPVGSSHNLEALMADIAEYISVGETPSSLEPLEIGSPCLAQFSEDDSWYRAKVTGKSGEEYQVVYVDYGNSELRPESKVQIIPESMLELPVQYIPCCLADIWANGDTWEKEIISFFRDLCEDKPLNARVAHKEDSLYHVYLTIDEDPTGWSVNRYLLSKGVELIPGSELEIELEMEDTVKLDQEASFHDISITKESSMDGSDIESEISAEKDGETEPEVGDMEEIDRIDDANQEQTEGTKPGEAPSLTDTTEVVNRTAPSVGDCDGTEKEEIRIALDSEQTGVVLEDTDPFEETQESFS